MAITRTYACGDSGRIIRQDNLAGAWIDITPNFPNINETAWYDIMSDPLDPDKVTVVGRDTLAGVGSGILVSTDAGVNWTNPAGTWLSADQDQYREVWYVDSNVIWAIANDGIVVLSTNAGVTFNKVSQPDKSLMIAGACIHALSDHIAVVASGGNPGGITGTTGYVWKTIDGGVNWTRLNGTLTLSGSPVGTPEGIWISADEQRIVVGTGYTQQLSTDGGATFNPIAPTMTRSGYHLTWFPSHSPNPPTMRHVGGDTFNVNESTDNGSSWSTIRSASPIIPGAHFYATDDGYYTSEGNVFTTADGAASGVISYNTPDGIGLWAVWTQLALVDPPAGCPCYLATNCEDDTDQVAIQIDCTLDPPSLNPNTVYQFSEPDYMVGKCWTIEEIDCPDQLVVDLSTGTIDNEGTLGTLFDQKDNNWKVVGVAPAGATTPSTPFPARISNQTWFSGYGAIPGSLWITAGQLDGSDTCPGINSPGCKPLFSATNSAPQHDQTTGLTIYELTFNAPINFVPLLNLTFIIDNTSPSITLNGNSLSYTPPAQPWVTPTIVTTSNPAFFNNGVNTLRITVDNQGTGSNGFAMGGSIENQNPPSVLAVPVSEWLDCDDCVDPVEVPNICWDLEVVCDGECDDIYAITGFDFTPFIGQNITIQPPLTDPECWYTPFALRQAVFVAAPQSSGGGYNLSWPFGAFQQGTDDITISIPSLIYNNVEQITGSPPTNLMTPANIQFVLCQQMACANVPVNNPGGLTGYANTVDFINATLASLGILTMQAYNNSFDNCPITIIKPRETFRLQYRDGDTFSFTVQYSNIGQGITTVVYSVAAGNVTVTILNGNTDDPLPTCNDNIWCLTDPADIPQIYSATVMGDCPVEPIDLGEACELTPRLGEPGFSTKNCDPKKVISVKCNYADSVYAQFKRARYGIDTCCEFDLDKIDIKNQLIDLGELYDPEACVDGTPIAEDCCLQPCNAVAELIIPQAVACPAPTDVDVELTIPAPPIPETTCFDVVFTLTGAGNADVPATVGYTDCCGVKQLIELIPTAGAITSVTACVDTDQPIGTDPTVVNMSITDVTCPCCPEPTNVSGNSIPIRSKVGIDTAECRTVTVVGVDDGEPPTSFMATDCALAPIDVVVVPGVPQVFCMNMAAGYTAGPNVQVTISGQCV